MELQEKAVTVAETRSGQLTRQAKAGARAEFDVIEANQEVQRRRATLIKARRSLEREQLKLALFIWEGDNPVVVGQYLRKVRYFNKRRSLNVNRRRNNRRSSGNLSTWKPESHRLEVADNNFLPN